MAYGRYNRRGRYAGRRYGNSAKSLAIQALKKIKYVEKEVAPENKVYIIDTIPVVVTQLGNVYDLIGAGSGYAGIQQGISINDRTGDAIKLQRMVLRGIVKRSQTAAIETVRLIIFRGKEDFGGAVPSPSYILESLDVYSCKNVVNRFATKTLYDKVFIVDDVKNQYFEFNINMPLNWNVTFETGLPVPSMGGLYMLIMSSTGTAANQPSWEGYFRITYTDA